MAKDAVDSAKFTETSPAGSQDKTTRYLRPSRRARTPPEKLPATIDPVPSFADDLSAAHQEIARLEKALALERSHVLQEVSRGEQSVMQAKQDMFLVVLKEQEEKTKLRRELERSKHQNQTLNVRLHTEMERSAEVRAQDRAKIIKLETDARAWEQEAEHSQSLNQQLEQDLVELRRIENEQRGEASTRPRGLPPAYGNINDDERFPPYDRYQDIGGIGPELYI